MTDYVCKHCGKEVYEFDYNVWEHVESNHKQCNVSMAVPIVKPKRSQTATGGGPHSDKNRKV